MTGIENAIMKTGSASALGALIGVSKMAVSLWRRNGVPAERVLPLFSATGVTPHELRPDLYPNPTDGLPKQEP
ncbi:YdaS family helix-turn-helix protein [Enterobacter bugandensis]|jgi:DNA-binding transcriptional regulator YdaS (Cro superfamily)|uniref:transcriptional regulator n=1 Tax=Enterobacter TaxID=547 RepID=UPI001594AA30|nr:MULTISPECIES: YdaS family helix-turn-helix protein [Enterobacter]HCM9506496.1 helix-turn-helix domain-containing protein [Enterobacter kobei]HEP0647970.1 helix-turn-helix domain-containing protein [Enterobacter hormaechei subsp. xiangfangensis]MCM7277940.1 helix-turn-helix domain-containing protein [Enterobacter bugandensis]WRU08380.1 YdaS family helix-turn-helix protein [Enterobacter bugandensis]HCM9509608.1 helix-turn-helix domain-containing protein [Enterobacter kobei]